MMHGQKNIKSVSYVFLLLCLYILIVMQVCSVLYILFSSCQLAFFGYPD